jgi:hypothetical protein
MSSPIPALRSAMIITRDPVGAQDLYLAENEGFCVSVIASDGQRS